MATGPRAGDALGSPSPFGPFADYSHSHERWWQMLVHHIFVGGSAACACTRLIPA